MSTSTVGQRIAIFAVCTAFFALCHWTSARAQTASDVTVCNQTVHDVAVGAGYYTPGPGEDRTKEIHTGPFVSHGWTLLKKGECDVVENRFHDRYIFLFHLTHNVLWEVHQELGGWEDASKAKPTRVQLCVALDEFTIELDHATIEDCHREGPRHYWVNTKMVDTFIDTKVTIDDDPAQVRLHDN